MGRQLKWANKAAYSLASPLHWLESRAQEREQKRKRSERERSAGSREIKCNCLADSSAGLARRALCSTSPRCTQRRRLSPSAGSLSGRPKVWTCFSCFALSRSLSLACLLFACPNWAPSWARAISLRHARARACPSARLRRASRTLGAMDHRPDQAPAFLGPKLNFGLGFSFSSLLLLGARTKQAHFHPDAVATLCRLSRRPERTRL